MQRVSAALSPKDPTPKPPRQGVPVPHASPGCAHGRLTPGGGPSSLWGTWGTRWQWVALAGFCTISAVLLAIDPIGYIHGAWLGCCLFFAGGAYALPAIIAYRRTHHQRMAIGALNLLLGWTGLGWCAALVWALTETRNQD